MINFTLQERRAFLLIGFLLLAGAIVNHVLKNNPEYISHVYYSEPSSEFTKININTALHKDLVKIKGIGPALASRIIEYRQHNGDFQSLTDIKKVKGIGDKKLEYIKKAVILH